jgi:hypothetical protein
METSGRMLLNYQGNNNISPEEWSASIEILKSKRVALFIVAYNAQEYIESVILDDQVF